MGEGRQAQRSDNRDSLIVHVDLVDASFIAINRRVGSDAQYSASFQFCILIDIRQINEKHGDAPQFRNPAALTRRKDG